MTVMFARPLFLDFALAHRIKRAFHSDGPKIDMRKNDRSQNQTDKCVPKLRVLHFFLRRQWIGQVGQPNHPGTPHC